MNATGPVDDTQHRRNAPPVDSYALQTTPSKADTEPKLCNCDGFWHVELEDGISRYVDVTEVITTTLTQQRDELLAQLPERTYNPNHAAMYRAGYNAAIDQVTAIIKGSTHG